MANERLTVKNFGPIREADLDLRKVTVLIGEQASGKSVLAKLVAICANYTAVQHNWLSKEELRNYKIETYLKDDCEFELSFKDFSTGYIGRHFYRMVYDEYSNSVFSQLEDARYKYFEISKKYTEGQTEEERETHRAEGDFWNKEIRLALNYIRTNFPETLYVPAERSTIFIVESLYKIPSRYETNIFDAWVSFRYKYNDFKKNLSGQPFRPLGLTFESDGQNDFVQYKNVRVNLGESASGFQSAIPIMVNVEGALKSHDKNIFIIEEPELNLYPTTQKKLVEYLIEKCTQGDNRLIITTHSPYILTALNNCIEASNVRKLHPESEAEVDKLVPRQYQIDYEDVMAYFVANGTAKPIMNEEYQIIDANALDDVSNELGRVFDSLLDLKYQNQE